MARLNRPKKAEHGGVRRGAGRPRKLDGVVLRVTVELDADDARRLEWIREHARVPTNPDAVREAIRRARP